MKYEIWFKGKIIGKFVTKIDRDICLECLMENFNDCANDFEKREIL